MVTYRGQEYHFGSHSDDGDKAVINVLHPDFFKKVVLFGDIGLGEGYVENFWETPDLAKTLSWFLYNGSFLLFAFSDVNDWGSNILGVIDRVLELTKTKNKLSQARKNIRFHYDMSNDFFELMLDKTMAYSSGCFIKSDDSLHQAQLNKFEEICCQLKLESTDHLLEIGSGWGGFSIYAAKKFGCRITTVTISSEQFAYIREKIKKEKIERLVDVQLTDYRDLTGKFDKIVSIEMVEAIGYSQLDHFAKKCTSFLKEGGIFSLQMITFNDHYYFKYIKSTNWIAKHVFPGSQLVSIVEFLNAFRRHGSLTVNHIRSIAPSYARTLSLWRENVHRHMARVKELGFDDTFIRKWDYYLISCQIAFALNYIDDVQITLVHKKGATLPKSMYEQLEQMKLEPETSKS